ncbi:PBP1A family penicillin-binding protein [Patescibacteria group bacterium]|nr:PBP1A family penicillin-binding protein [Patescibacteria group bacterium]
MKRMIKSGQTWASQRKRPRTKRLRKIVKHLKKRGAFKNLVLAAVALFLFATIVFLGLFAWISRDLPDPNSLTTRELAQSTKIYDRTGEHLLYEIAGDEKRTLVKIDQIPEYVKWATVAAEDRKFYEHGGIDVKGIFRALLFNVSTLDPTGQGGSTITQQLIKNAILTNEQTYTRKIKEILLALALERRYTKDEILQLYLNEIPYGSTNYGIQSASQSYFGKNVEKLSIAEAATITGLPKAPTMLLNDLEKLKQRRDWIIQGMEELEYITEKQAQDALAEEMNLRISLTGIEAPHFVLWVKEQLEETYGQRMVEQGGLRVITTLDYDKQQIAEEAVENNKTERSERYGFNNSGLVAVDPSTGQIMAMVGSADYFDDEIDGQVNVTLRPLQPGSSFKPIIYSAGFEKGYTPNTILWDVETTFPTATGPYAPRNYDLVEHGPVTVRTALQGSFNIPAVKMLYLVGVQQGLDFAERLGYSTFENRSNFGLAIVLGGAEVKLLEHVAAYASFATEGIYHEPVAILRVEDDKGKPLEEWKEDDGKRVMDKNIARTITNVLSDNAARAFAFGAHSLLTLPGRPVAAKTGTTDSYKDAWTLGYTPSLVAGVWTGNTDGTAMSRGSGGSTVAAPIWNEFMRRALEGTGVEFFNAPNIPVTGKSILDGEIPSEQVVIDTASGKLATDRTPDRFREEKVCGEYHAILHFVNRNNPLGDAPKDPGRDPHYEAWEAAIADHLVRQNENLEEGEVPLEVCEIPEEEDDLHIAENEPQIKIKSPKNEDDVGRTIATNLRINAPRGVSRVEYLIDGSLVALDIDPAGSTFTLPSWVSSGSHVLEVIAYDDIDNAGRKEVAINVTEEGTEGSITITNPFNNQVIEKIEESYSIVLEIASPGDFASLRVTAQNLWTGGSTTIYEATSPTAFVVVEWVLPEAAHYLLSSTATNQNGDRVDAAPIRVTVQDMPGTEDEAALSLIENNEEEEGDE